ncbi:MAG: AI-2E family transporter [Saprospiraceae bacterium]|nr:AI-2E family transporter [Saprospiraceae bacterium]MDW8483502.1 AI-2E family transporter [Saprospiraceae bacterium]
MRNLLLWAAGVVIFGAVVYFFSTIVSYVIAASVLAMLGRPLKDFLQRRVRLGRWRIGAASASFLTILCFLGVILGFFLLFVPTLLAQIKHLSTIDYATLGERLKAPLAEWDVWLRQAGFLEPGQTLGRRIQEALISFFQPARLGNWISSAFSLASNTAIAIVSVSFILFFLLKEDDLITGVIYSIMPAHLRRKLLHAIDEAGAVLTRYLRGLALQTLSFMAIASAALWLLGVPNALLLGILGGLFNIIPYLGPLIGIAVGCFFTLIYFIEADFKVIGLSMLKVVAAFGFTQLIDNLLLYPYITSSSVRAHPLEIFLVILAAAQLGGPIGMIIGVPLYTVARAVIGVFFSEFQLVQRWASRNDNPPVKQDEGGENKTEG